MHCACAPGTPTTFLSQLSRRDSVAGQENPTIGRRLLGAELRRLRLAARLTIEEVAEALEISSSKISRMETARVPASVRDVRDLLQLYGVYPEEQERLMQLARDARKKDWWHAYSDVHPSAFIGMEAAADEIRVLEMALVPGLLQTADYARAVIRALRPRLLPHQVDRWVELREARQAMLAQSASKAMWAVIEEGVLRRPTGGRDVMRQQLRRLVEDSSLGIVAIQVLPFHAEQDPATYGSFTILGFQDPALPDVVYLENTTRELLVESEEELLLYKQAFERLRGSALDRDASARLLAEFGKEL